MDNMLIVLGLRRSLKEVPASALRLIRRMPEPNQSVINFLYGSNLDDKMSGRALEDESELWIHPCKYMKREQ